MDFNKLKKELQHRENIKILEFERRELDIQYIAKVEKKNRKYKIIEIGKTDNGCSCRNTVELKNYRALKESIEQYIQVLDKNKIKYLETI